MYKLDNIDKKIIYEMEKNARLSYRQVAQKIGSKKEIVAYHFNQLLKDKIINKMMPVFSITKLGIYACKIYLKLHGIDKENEKKLYDFLINNKAVSWIARCTGKWDILIAIYCHDIVEFSLKKNQILSRFSRFIQDYDITLIEDALVFSRDYLIGKSVDYRKSLVFGGKKESIQIKDYDKEIIRLIRNDARFSITEISEKIGVDSRTVIARIRYLEKKQVLQGYTIFLNLQKIGYKLFKLCLYLSDYKIKDVDKLISYIKQNPNVIHIIKALGSWELEIEIEYDDIYKTYDYINELKTNFPEMIKRIDLAIIMEEVKWDMFPEWF